MKAEIEQGKSALKETEKEVKKATSESAGGSCEKVLMLQSKMQMKEQEILVKQMKIKEIMLSLTKTLYQHIGLNSL